VTVTSPSCAILIPNWNGIRHLEHLLPSLSAAAACYEGPVSVVVVDNRSSENDVTWIRERFPDVEVLVAERNDFLFSLNPVAESRTEDVLIVLNNDMRVEADFIAPLARHFADSRIFAVMARIMDWDGRERTNGQRVMWTRHCWFYKAWRMEEPGPCHSVEACGGASAYRRDRFVALGGFDPLFRPGYYEDLDLSYRAWMQGWRVVYEPASVVYHRVGASFNTHFGAGERERRERFDAHLYRNEALFTVKNVGGLLFLAGYLALLPIRVLRSMLAGRRAQARGLLAAVPLLARAMRARRRPRGAPRPAEIAARVLTPLPAVNVAPASPERVTC
jgi:GT2 family glycosyltransferase